MQLMRLGEPGAERPVVRVDETSATSDRSAESASARSLPARTVDPYVIVRYLSQFMVLEPRDLINTGTPPGVGLGMKPPRYLEEGDVMTLGIERLGMQRQRVVATPGEEIRWAI